MFLSKNKKQNKAVFTFALLLFSLGVFFLAPFSVHAGFFGFVGDSVEVAFKGLLYGIFVIFGWFASIGITLFEWAIKPDYISGSSGLLNRASVYEMWKFIRDFFNLFFILTLLYTAFTIVFQVAKDYKKTLLSLVLAALFVNFSFPITRVIIDATNVPMYYFANQMGSTGANQKDFLGTVLSASQIQKILIPGSEDGGTVDFDTVGVSQLLMAIIFLFIFSITILVLAVLFVVRLAALVILLIFASVGFAAAVIPGMGEYSAKWWKALWQYAFFGPAAMLMLFVATRFFAEISSDNTKAQFLNVATANTTPETAGFISAMAMFSIPIIMLWFAIGLGSSMSIAGAGMVTGKGQQFLKWAGRKTYNNPVGRGLYGGAKKIGMEGKVGGANYGKIPGVGKFLTGNFWASPSKTEAFIKGGMGGGKGGVQTELAKLHQQAVNKAVKENKENQVNRSSLLGDLDSSDTVERQAAALSLAENGEIRSANDLTKALTALRSGVDKQGKNTYDDGATDMMLRVIDKAKDGATAGMDQNTYDALADSDAFYVKDKGGKVETKDGKEGGEKVVGSVLESLQSKLKKDGQIMVRVNYEIKQKEARGTDPAEARTKTYNELIGKLSADDLGKQRSIHSALADDAALKSYFKERVHGDTKYYQEAFKKMSQADRDKWDEEGISPETDGKQTDEGKRLREKFQERKQQSRA